MKKLKNYMQQEVLADSGELSSGGVNIARHAFSGCTWKIMKII